MVWELPWHEVERHVTSVYARVPYYPCWCQHHSRKQLRCDELGVPRCEICVLSQGPFQCVSCNLAVHEGSRQLPTQGAPALARIVGVCAGLQLLQSGEQQYLSLKSHFTSKHAPLRSTRVLTGRRPLPVFGDGAESMEWALLGPALGTCTSPVCQRSLLQLCSWGAFRVVIFEH